MSVARRDRRVLHQRPHDHLPRVPAGLRRGRPTRPAREGRRARSACRSSPRGDALDPRGFEAEGHSTSPPARYTEPSLVKAMEELGVGRPVDLCLDHADDPGSRLRVEEGSGARPVLDGVRGDRAARVLLRPPRRLRLHRVGRERPGRDRRRRANRGSSGCAGSTSARTTSTDTTRISAQGGLEATDRRRGWRRSTPAGSTRSRSSDRTSSCGSVATGRTCSGARSGASLPEDLAPDELTPRRSRSCCRRRPATATSARPPMGARSPPRPAGTART